MIINIRARSQFMREIKAGVTKQVGCDCPIPHCGIKNMRVL